MLSLQARGLEVCEMEKVFSHLLTSPTQSRVHLLQEEVPNEAVVLTLHAQPKNNLDASKEQSFGCYVNPD